MRPILHIMWTALQSFILRDNNNDNDNDTDTDTDTDTDNDNDNDNDNDSNNNNNNTNNNDNNQRPITCLNTLYKWFTSRLLNIWKRMV